MIVFLRIDLVQFNAISISNLFLTIVTIIVTIAPVELVLYLDLFQDWEDSRQHLEECTFLQPSSPVIATNQQNDCNNEHLKE